VVDRHAWALLWDYIVISDLAKELPSESPRSAEALTVANDMINIYDPNDRSTWEYARQIAAKFLNKYAGGFNIAC
jgi:alpha-mannosidase